MFILGSSEDELRLRLRLPSVPGHARPLPAVPTPCAVSYSVRTWPQMERSSSSSTKGRPRRQVIGTGVADISTRPASFAAPGYGGGPERYSNYAPTTASSQCRPCQGRRLARRRQRRGDRTTTALVLRLGSGWRRHRRSGLVSLAADSKFVSFVDS